MTERRWHDVIPVDIAGDPHGSWLWQHVEAVLGLQTSGPVATCWGSGPIPDGVAAAVRVPRDEAFEPTPAGLRRLMSGVGHAVEAGSVAMSGDVLTWAGWLLSRAEEYDPHRLDSAGRFRHDDSLLFRAGLTDVPVVDMLLMALRTAVEEATRIAGLDVQRRSPWPQGKQFAVCLTHDIDHAVRRSAYEAARKLGGAGVALALGRRQTSRRRVNEAIGLARGGEASPYWLMSHMAQQEAARGFRSTFFVLPHKRRRVQEGSVRARRYDVRRPDIQLLLHELDVNGWEIGMHTSYDAHDTVAGLATDWKTLQSELPAGVQASGARSHYLRLRMPDTLRHAEEAGLRYDATMGWATGWGFRSGSATPYHPFDLSRDRELDLWELDLHVMDGAVAARDFATSLGTALERVREVRGCATVLVHPSPYDDMTVEEHLDLYDKVLECVAGFDDAWVTTPAEVLDRMDAYSRLSPAAKSAAQGQG